MDRGETEQAFELSSAPSPRALVDALAGGLDIRCARAPTTASAGGRADPATTRARWAGRAGRVGPLVLDLERHISVILEELRLAGVDDLERLSLLEARIYPPQAHLDARTALVEYYIVGSDLVGVRHDPRRNPWPADARAVPSVWFDCSAGCSSTWTRPRRRPICARSLEPNARALLQRLFTFLLGPVARQLAGYDRLVIVPARPAASASVRRPARW